MSRYEMIAFDMDGTLLNSKKEITAPVVEAIGEAVKAGKKVVLSTGRSLSELRLYGNALKDVQYWCIESGAMVYDSWNDVILFRSCFDEKAQEVITSITGREDTDTILLGMSRGESYFGARLLEQIDHYNLAPFRSLYEVCGTKVEDDRAFFAAYKDGFEKINIFCTSPAEREIILARLEESGAPITLAKAEISNIECSPRGVTKATGLRELCGSLGISTDNVIAVGDADNDLDMLGAVGFPIAMGNANEHAKAAAKAIVADNDHDGTKEAIEKYLLLCQ